MATVTDYLSKILNKQKEIGYKMPQYIKPGLSDSQIDAVVQRLGFPFNQEYREYLKMMDGVQEPTDENGAFITLIQTLFRLVSTYRLESSFVKENAFQDIKELYEGMETISSIHVPILAESHANCLWVNLDANDKYFGYVLKTIMWGGVDYVYSSISKMFETICVAYEKNYIFLANERVDILFDEFYDLAKEINPEIEYWAK